MSSCPSRFVHYIPDPSTQGDHVGYDAHRSGLPILPLIKDEALQLVPFTHPAYYHSHTLKKLHITYDRLEFLGDSYIGLMAARLVYNDFPNLPPGALTQQRELIIKNETLAEYALAYGFDKKVRGIPEDMDQSNPKSWTKIMGDVFEAYVAAVILSDPDQGFQTAEAWLTSLWNPKLSSHQNKLSSSVATCDYNAKTDLAKMIMGKGIRLDYLDEREPIQVKNEGKNVFSVGVYLTGWGWEKQHLGSATGLSKNAAGARAAAKAKENPLTDQIMAKKKEFDAKVAAERALQEQQVSPKDMVK